MSAVALHPEATADAATLRWVVPGFEPPFLGEVRSAPGLDDLEQGVVERVDAAPASLLVTLAPGRNWRADGARIRHALITALSHPERWVGGDDAVVLDADGLLRRVAADAIDGPIGAIAASHGGGIELVDARRVESWLRLAPTSGRLDESWL